MAEARESKTLIRDFTHGKIFTLLLTFALPLMGANLLQTVYNLVDMMVVGKVVGQVGLSAVSIGGDVLHFTTFLVMGFAGAGQVILSQYIGAGQTERVNAAIGTLFTVTLASSVVIAAGCILFMDPILEAMNTPDEAMADARVYAVTCTAGLVFIYGYNLVSAILRGMGDSRRPLLFIGVATVINLVLDLLFVAVFEMGVLGAALATVIGQSVSFLWALVFLYRRKEAFHFDFKPRSFRPDRTIFPTLLKLGLPMALQFAAIQFSLVYVRAFLNDYGVTVSAVTGVGNKLNSVSMVVSNAISTAGSSMIGQNLGAGEYGRVPRIIGASLAINLTFASIISAATLCFPRLVFGLFNDEAEVLAMAVTYAPVSALAFLASALRSPFMALINGSGNSRLNLTVGILDGIVCRIGLALLLGITAGFGIHGFWYGSALAGYVPFFIGLVFFASGVWRTPPKAVRQVV